jgi:hypothetical protein
MCLHRTKVEWAQKRRQTRHLHAAHSTQERRPTIRVYPGQNYPKPHVLVTRPNQGAHLLKVMALQENR